MLLTNYYLVLGTQLNGGNDWNKQSLIGNGSDSNDIWSMNAQPQQRSNLFSNNAWGKYLLLK